jgi:beta-phosphoglucomutase-like phosphatase (HAD superfamily)
MTAPVASGGSEIAGWTLHPLEKRRLVTAHVAGSRFELVIFDCDGVLVDSEPIINQAHANVLTACGYPVAGQDLVDRFCGMSDPEMLRLIEREWGRRLPASYTKRVGLMIEAGFRQSLAAIAGITEMLDLLAIPVCVASIKQFRD